MRAITLTSRYFDDGLGVPTSSGRVWVGSRFRCRDEGKSGQPLFLNAGYRLASIFSFVHYGLVVGEWIPMHKTGVLELSQCHQHMPPEHKCPALQAVVGSQTWSKLRSTDGRDGVVSAIQRHLGVVDSVVAAMHPRYPLNAYSFVMTW